MKGMGIGEGGTPKVTKTTTGALEPVAHPSYTEWAAAFQAYYGTGATPPRPGYFPTTVASGPQPHPFLWGGQPLMAPPYGTPPPPHTVLYPYGGIYAHPSMPPGTLPYTHHGLAASAPALEVPAVGGATSTERDVKSLDSKDRNTMKRSKGSFGDLGGMAGKRCDATNGASESANGHTQSGESGSEASSEASAEDTPQNDFQRGDCYQLITANGQGANPSRYGMQGRDAYMTQPGVPTIGNPANTGPVTGTLPLGPTTNLHIGMEYYWNGCTGAAPTDARGKRSSSIIPATQNAQVIPGRDSISAELWLQDERELKRQRRKQSNRESARRSRLRKQAECEELGKRVDALTVENMALRTELRRLTEECKKLSSENAVLHERLGRSGSGSKREENEEDESGL